MGLTLTYQDGQTPLDDEERDGLLIKSITLREELDELEQLNIQNAIEWTLKTKYKAAEILSESFVKLLHVRMYGEIWRWAGSFRKSNKNLGVDKYMIGTELKKLLDDTSFVIQNRIYGEEEIAIRFKHRIVSIHCFPNGNGRHSRLMADIIVNHIFGKEVFSWSMQNLVKDGDPRAKYMKALREADNGDIKPLMQFARS